MKRAKPICLVQIPGPLVDFVGTALKRHGASLKPADVRLPLNKQLGLSDSKFWSKLSSRHVWAKMPLCEGAKELVQCLENLFGERHVYLVASPMKATGSAHGLLDLVETHFRRVWETQRIIIGRAKDLLAGPGRYLVDDKDADLEAFVKAGGNGVLTARPWNARRDEVYHPFKLAFELRDLLQSDGYEVPS